MSQKELLQKYISQEADNLFNASANYLMTQPMPGREDEWREAKERLAGLERIAMFLGIQNDVDAMAEEQNKGFRLTVDLRMLDMPEFREVLKEFEEKYDALERKLHERQNITEERGKPT